MLRCRHSINPPMESEEMMAQSQANASREAVRDVVPDLINYSEKWLFGEVWERPGLKKRDRSLIVVATLIALGRERQLVGHLNRALDNGVTKQEISEIITHLAAGAVWADTPKALAEQSEVIFTSLPGPPEVEQVALGPNGLLAGMRDGAAYFDLSTNSPTLVRELNRRFAEKHVYMLDAPVS